MLSFKVEREELSTSVNDTGKAADNEADQSKE